MQWEEAQGGCEVWGEAIYLLAAVGRKRKKKKKNQSSAGMNLRPAEQLGASDPGRGGAGRGREDERDELRAPAVPGSR